jgi:hypothetical protein
MGCRHCSEIRGYPYKHSHLVALRPNKIQPTIRRQLGAGRAVNNDEGATMNGSRYYVVRSEGTKYGIGFGSALAMAISFTTNKSILWAIIHGILGWLYVIYLALFRS